MLRAMPNQATSSYLEFRMFLTIMLACRAITVLDTLFGSKVGYDQLLDEPRFVDKFGGLPVIRNLTELKDVVHRSGRTWVVLAPYASLRETQYPDVVDYIRANSKADFESYRVKVFLFQGAQPGIAAARTF